MRFNFWIILTILLSPYSRLTAQWGADFETEDLSDWFGDVDLFNIEDARLRLNANASGNAQLWSEVPYMDSLLWHIDLELGFSPSNQNKLEIWLLADNPDPNTANGYLLSIGETGADDAIKLLFSENGAQTLLAEGIMGQVGSKFYLTIQVSKNNEDIWTLYTGSPSSTLLKEAFQLPYPTATLPSKGYFGINCTFTSSNVDKFYFDNLAIDPLLPDTRAPELVSYKLVNNDKIQLTFSEIIEESSARNLSNYTGVSLNSVDINQATSNVLCLNVMGSLPSGAEVELIVSGLKDASGNSLYPTTITLTPTETPLPGELLINEIMFEPLSGRSADFVELINVSNKNLSLDSVFLARANSTAVDKQIESGYILKPNEIIAFTTDTTEIKELYQPIPDAQLYQQSITNYVGGEGNVWVRALHNGQLITIDSFEYTNDYHYQLLTSDQKKGVSLERVSPIGDTNDGGNWFSASSSANYGTPGYENSQRSAELLGDEKIQLDSKVFSPNGDGYQDLLRLNYSLDKNGYVANIAVYDDKGRFQTRISDNKLLGTEGFVIWDGLLEDGTRAPIGLYILYYDIFHTDGQVISGKKVCTLAQQLN